MTDDTFTLTESKAIGDTLKSARHRLNMSVDELAAKAKKSKRRLLQVEAGGVKRRGSDELNPTRLSRDELKKICGILEIDRNTTDRLLVLSNYKPLEQNRKIAYYDDLSEDDQRQVDDLIDYLRHRGR